MGTDFTEDQCEELFKAPKRVASALAWKQKEDNPYVYMLRASVVTTDGMTSFDLTGIWNCRSKYSRVTWSFSLKFHGFTIRSYDMAKKHHNPGNGWIQGPHKHRFVSSLIDRFAYKPDPPISEENANQALIDFLLEANIEVPTTYQFFMFP